MLSGITSAQVLNAAQNRLIALRTALEGVADLQSWMAGVSQAELETAGFSAADAAAVMSAVADANALAQVYDTGLPPSTYPQPPTAYVYGASQRIVIGPQ